LPNWICEAVIGVGDGDGVKAGAQVESGLLEGAPASQVICILNASDALPR